MRRLLTVLLVALNMLFVGGVVALAIGVVGEEADCDDFRFDRAAWERPVEFTEETTERQRIADRLIACHVLAGATRGEVRRMLGRGAPPSEGDRALSYPLGLQRDSYFAIDGEHLVVRFDDRERVATVEILSD